MTGGKAPSEPPEPLTAAVIGAGRISEEHLRFLAGSKRANLLGVCDTSPAMVRFAADRFGAPRALSDHRQLLEELKPQVVHVVTPPHTHVQIVEDCLDAGAHVVVEKPLATSYAEFEQLWSKARSCERWLVEDHNYRFNRPILAIESMVRNGSIGDVREVDVRMALPIREPGNRYADRNLPHPSHRLPAGVLHEFLTHLCYLTLRFTPESGEGDGFHRIRSAWSNHGGGSLFKFDDLDALIVCGEVHARIRFSCSTWPGSFTVAVRGTRASVSVDLFRPSVLREIPRPMGQQIAPLINQWAQGWHMVRRSLANFLDKIRQRTPYEGLSRFLDLTYRAIAEGSEPPVTYSDMKRTSRLIDTLLEEGNRM